jgi:hypothetical protein
MQMKHSSLTIQEAAEVPMPGKSLEDLDLHIASHLAAGWLMAQYAVHTTSTGIRHHFIWQGPEEGSPFPEGMDPRMPAVTDDGTTGRV